jgi:flagellar motility protein MotE (MotC chaperone)
MTDHLNCDKEFQARRNQLIQELILANTHLDVWNAINQQIKEDVEPLKPESDFWKITMRAHLHEAFMCVARITDQHQKSANLHRFLTFTGAHQELFNENALRARRVERQIPASVIDRKLRELPEIRKTLRQARTLLKEAAPVLERLRERRDKILAHIDDEIVFGRIETESVFSGIVNDLPDSPILREEFEHTLGVLGRVLNCINGHYEGVTWQFGIPDAASDVRRILSYADRVHSRNAPTH